jgi:hypothetical protein
MKSKQFDQQENQVSGQINSTQQPSFQDQEHHGDDVHVVDPRAGVGVPGAPQAGGHEVHTQAGVGGQDRTPAGIAEYEAPAIVEIYEAPVGMAKCEDFALVEDNEAPAGDTDHNDLAMVEGYKEPATGEDIPPDLLLDK